RPTSPIWHRHAGSVIAARRSPRRERDRDPGPRTRTNLRYARPVISLFANQRETNLASAVALVEQVLSELGHPPATSQLDDGAHAWRITQGSAITRITVVQRSAFPHLRVSAIVMTLDAAVDRAALFAHLLELNAGLCGVAFATDGDQVLLVSERSTLDLDHSEVRDAIERVTTYADEHDDVLVARFGGRVGAAT
ncbi:MAG: YbjN domain-containing protein, partial [Deltaproteobacteria bacterium]